jgi:hypothetical protein
VTGRKAASVVTGVAILLVSITACVSPAFDADHYRQQALQSVTADESELQTTRMVLEVAIANRILATTADEMVSEAETAASSVAASFQAVQPSVSTDGARRRTMRFLGEVEDAISQARIAIRRDDAQGMRSALDRIQSLLVRSDAVREPLR